ncbi:hypothetical protein K438DRAFT_1979535 [Mycena galopus ATCC 62051]|nr:hypothetical protein K438DRAFT_1979535 [Mycena galopus ATCC 62051]
MSVALAKLRSQPPLPKRSHAARKQRWLLRFTIVADSASATDSSTSEDNFIAKATEDASDDLDDMQPVRFY